MKMITYVLIAVFAVLMNGMGWAGASHFPQELLFNHQPIDALCFFPQEYQSDRINLEQCGIAKKKLVVKGQNALLIQQGFIGYDWQDPHESYPAQGYSYYKMFQAADHHYWIYTLNNGGGNGSFTAVSLVKRHNAKTLMVKNIMSGDRCNGGIEEVKEKNHHLLFSVHLTAYDLLMLKNKHAPLVKAYDDIAACAVCCVAKAVFEVDRELKLKLKSVDLGHHSLDVSQLPTQGRYQSCFNQLLVAFMKKNKSPWDSSKLHALQTQFDQTCMSSTR